MHLCPDELLPLLAMVSAARVWWQHWRFYR